MSYKKYPLKKLVLGYQGLFDFGGLYRVMVNFFKNRHYDYEYEVYKDKEGSPIGHEVELKVKPDKKLNEYVKYHYDINWMNWDWHEVEVVRNGKAVKLAWARFKFTCTGIIEIDWQDLGKNNKKMLKFFDEYVIKREITELHEPTLTFEQQALIDEMKAFLNMEVTRLDKEVI